MQKWVKKKEKKNNNKKKHNQPKVVLSAFWGGRGGEVGIQMCVPGVIQEQLQSWCGDVLWMVGLQMCSRCCVPDVALQEQLRSQYGDVLWMVGLQV